MKLEIEVLPRKKWFNLITCYLSVMGVTIQQWRAAIGRPAPHLKVKKEDEDNSDVGREVGDYGRRLMAKIMMTIMWMLLAHWVMTFSVTKDVAKSENESQLE